MKVCILGASGDIGNRCSKALRESGYGTIDCLRLGRGVLAGPKGGNAETAYISTRNLSELRTGFKELLTKARVGCVVNALGIGRSTHSPGQNIPIPTEELTIEEWEEVIYVNLKIPIMVTEIAMEFDVNRVIHIGSALTAYGLHGTAMAQAYSASKKGLFEYCDRKNNEEGSEMSVACLAPGLVRTKMTEGSGLLSLFKGELEAESVAKWVVKVLEHESIANNVQLPMKTEG